MDRKLKVKCVVPLCENNNHSISKKIFFCVPTQNEMAKLWQETLKTTFILKHLFCCEDHFDITQDTENWLYFKFMGTKLKLKNEVLPHKNLDGNKGDPNYSQYSDFDRKQKLKRLQRAAYYRAKEEKKRKKEEKQKLKRLQKAALEGAEEEKLKEKVNIPKILEKPEEDKSKPDTISPSKKKSQPMKKTPKVIKRRKKAASTDPLGGTETLCNTVNETICNKLFDTSVETLVGPEKFNELDENIWAEEISSHVLKKERPLILRKKPSNVKKVSENNAYYHINGKRYKITEEISEVSETDTNSINDSTSKENYVDPINNVASKEISQNYADNNVTSKDIFEVSKTNANYTNDLTSKVISENYADSINDVATAEIFENFADASKEISSIVPENHAIVFIDIASTEIAKNNVNHHVANRMISEKHSNVINNVTSKEISKVSQTYTNFINEDLTSKVISQNHADPINDNATTEISGNFADENKEISSEISENHAIVFIDVASTEISKDDVNHHVANRMISENHCNVINNVASKVIYEASETNANVTNDDLSSKVISQNHADSINDIATTEISGSSANASKEISSTIPENHAIVFIDVASTEISKNDVNHHVANRMISEKHSNVINNVASKVIYEASQTNANVINDDLSSKVISQNHADPINDIATTEISGNFADASKKVSSDIPENHAMIFINVASTEISKNNVNHHVVSNKISENRSNFLVNVASKEIFKNYSDSINNVANKVISQNHADPINSVGTTEISGSFAPASKEISSEIPENHVFIDVASKEIFKNDVNHHVAKGKVFKNSNLINNIASKKISKNHSNSISNVANKVISENYPHVVNNVTRKRITKIITNSSLFSRNRIFKNHPGINNQRTSSNDVARKEILKSSKKDAAMHNSASTNQIIENEISENHASLSNDLARKIISEISENEKSNYNLRSINHVGSINDVAKQGILENQRNSNNNVANKKISEIYENLTNSTVDIVNKESSPFLSKIRPDVSIKCKSLSTLKKTISVNMRKLFELSETKKCQVKDMEIDQSKKSSLNDKDALNLTDNVVIKKFFLIRKKPNDKKILTNAVNTEEQNQQDISPLKNTPIVKKLKLVPTKKFQCPYCSVLTSRILLIDHVYEIHSINKYCCPFCSWEHKDEITYLQHLHKHSEPVLLLRKYHKSCYYNHSFSQNFRNVDSLIKTVSKADTEYRELDFQINKEVDIENRTSELDPLEIKIKEEIVDVENSLIKTEEINEEDPLNMLEINRDKIKEENIDLCNMKEIKVYAMDF